VRLHKNFIMPAAIAAAILIGPAASAYAQPHGHGHGGGAVVVVGGGYYGPAFGLQYGYPYPYPYPVHPYGYGYGPYDPDASVKLEVKPKNAEVYVDGFYAGVVDDFDGSFQRLHVEPGEHEIELWLQGFKTVRQKVYLTPNKTFKVKYQMEQLAAGQSPEPKPQPVPPPPDGNDPRMQPPPQRQQPMGPGPSTRRMPPPAPGDPRGQEDPRVQPNPRGGQGNGAYGTLAIKVQPGDAEIAIDGESWRGPGGQDRLIVEVAEGSHTVEIRKAGFRTYVTQVDVHRGQTTPLNVSLRGEQQ
jgi:hypothetical protein